MAMWSSDYMPVHTFYSSAKKNKSKQKKQEEEKNLGCLIEKLLEAPPDLYRRNMSTGILDLLVQFPNKTRHSQTNKPRYLINI